MNDCLTRCEFKFFFFIIVDESERDNSIITTVLTVNWHVLRKSLLLKLIIVDAMELSTFLLDLIRDLLHAKY